MWRKPLTFFLPVLLVASALASAQTAAAAQSETDGEGSAIADQVLVIHDSVILGARRQIESALSESRVDYLGFGGLRVGPAADLVEDHPHLLGDQVVVEIGTNYLGSQTLFRNELDRLMGLLSDVDHVLWLTPSRHRPLIDNVREEIRSAAHRYPNLQIAEWGPLSDANHNYTWGDGIHLQPGGADAIAELIRSHLAGEVPWNQLPEGSIASVRDGRKSVRIGGWAINPDLGRPAMVRLTLDGKLVAKKRTHRRRVNLAASLESDVVKLGFEFKVDIPDGSHEICIEANNFDGRDRVVMDCRTVELAHNPVGAIDRVVEKSDGDVVRGWASDPDRKVPLKIEIHEGTAADANRIVAVAVANRESAKAVTQAAADGAAENHFAIKIPADVEQYCVVARNVLAGTDVVLDCRVSS